jgi:hypothetical protein
MAFPMMTRYSTGRHGIEVGLEMHSKNVISELGDRKAIILDIEFGAEHFLRESTRQHFLILSELGSSVAAVCWKVKP